jgi:hypothetical protein
MWQAFAVVLEIIDNADFIADRLPEPNRCRVADAQIPSGVNRETRLARNGTDLPGGLNRIQYRAIVGPLNCSIGIALELRRMRKNLGRLRLQSCFSSSNSGCRLCLPPPPFRPFMRLLRHRLSRTFRTHMHTPLKGCANVRCAVNAGFADNRDRRAIEVARRDLAHVKATSQLFEVAAFPEADRRG